MRIKEGFVMREMAGGFVAVPVEGESREFQGMVQLNETGAFLWKELEQECRMETLVDALMNTYEVSRKQAEMDARKTVEMLKKAGILRE